MSRVDTDFNEKVYAFVAEIPALKVATYGQIAAACGAAWAAWEVGQIAHTGPVDLPWQRVVNKKGGLARGYPGGMAGHRQVLEAEGFDVSDDFTIEIGKYLWRPKK